jgi:hypothetical protein
MWRLLILTPLLLTGCISRIAESRVRSALLANGLSPKYADCMAERMVDRLSIGQLRKLERLQGLGQTRTPAAFVAKVRSVNDSEALAVVTSSAAVCALR